MKILKNFIIKISERGDMHDFSASKGGVPSLGVWSGSVEKTGRQKAEENAVLLPITWG